MTGRPDSGPARLHPQPDPARRMTARYIPTMAVQLTTDSIDLGIVVRDATAALAFYRDTLGLADLGSNPMPGGGGTMYRLGCGTSTIKIVHHDEVPEASAPPGGIAGASGYRYWTISVSNLHELTDACAASGRRVVVKPREIRPGTSISIVEDPDGNWVEFLQST